MSGNQKDRAARGARRDIVARGPFHGTVLDLAIADRTQAELFAAVVTFGLGALIGGHLS